MAIYPLIKQQQVLFRQANILITEHEQSMKDLERTLIHKQDNTKQNWEQAQKEVLDWEEQLKRTALKIETFLSDFQKNGSFADGKPEIFHISSHEPKEIFDNYIETVSKQQAILTDSFLGKSKDYHIYTIDKDRRRIAWSYMTIIGTIIIGLLLLLQTNYNIYNPVTIVMLLLGGIISLLLVILFIVISVAIHRTIWTKRKNCYATIMLALSSAKSLAQQKYNKAQIVYEKQTEENKRQAQEYRYQSEQKLTSGIAELNSNIFNYRRDAKTFGAEWQDIEWQDWQPATTLIPLTITRIGTTNISYKQQLVQSFPLFIPFPGERGLFLQAPHESYRQATVFLQSLLLRLLAAQCPGMVQFTFIDPLNFGQSIAPFMQLADIDPSLVGSRIWTESSHIEQQLSTLSEYLAHVNQRYFWGTTSTIKS